MKDLRAVFMLFWILHGSGFTWAVIREYIGLRVQGKSSLDALKELERRLQEEVIRARWQAARANG